MSAFLVSLNNFKKKIHLKHFLFKDSLNIPNLKSCSPIPNEVREKNDSKESASYTVY